ncbi:MAG TPA: thioredoxin domain-containing protein [Magnetospirillaceae bacterium]|nr:thioredoxin domain-containing protein [Magnetospirillaceae bacterium]
MNKKLLVVAMVITLVIAAGFAFLLMRDKPANVPIMQGVVEDTNPVPEPEPPAEQKTPGAYKIYSPEAVAATKGTKILFFYAAWCPQCRQLDGQITAGPLPDNVTIFKVDYDTNQSLRQKYGVQLQTTMVKIDDNGNSLQKFVAYDNPTLASLIENML